MYNSTEGNQLIIVMTEREVLFNDICNGLYHNDLEDCDLVLVKRLKNQELLPQRELSEARAVRRALGGVHPKKLPIISFASMYKNNLFIVGIGTIFNKEI